MLFQGSGRIRWSWGGRDIKRRQRRQRGYFLSFGGSAKRDGVHPGGKRDILKQKLAFSMKAEKVKELTAGLGIGSGNRHWHIQWIRFRCHNLVNSFHPKLLILWLYTYHDPHADILDDSTFNAILELCYEAAGSLERAWGKKENFLDMIKILWSPPISIIWSALWEAGFWWCRCWRKHIIDGALSGEKCTKNLGRTSPTMVTTSFQEQTIFQSADPTSIIPTA